MHRNVICFIAGAFLAAFLLLVCPLPAHAENPGDPCTNTDVYPALQVGDAHIIVCNGTVWKSVMDITNNGQSSLQVENDTGACNSDKLGRMRYDDALDTWQYCDGTNWVDLVTAAGGGLPYPFSFSNLTDQSINTLVSSDIIPISGFTGTLSVSITGSGTPQFQICSTYNCSTVVQTWGSTAQNISSGQYLQLRHTTAATASTTANVAVTVGNAVVSWGTTTMPPLVAFVTSTTYTGATVAGVDGADAACQARADAAGLSGTFRAWIDDTDPANAPATRFPKYNTIYQMTNGTKIADGWTDLTDGTLDAALTYSESAVNQGAQFAWTNVQASGTQYNSSTAFNCSDWSSTATNGRIGATSSTSSFWASNSTVACTNSYRLYCFQTSFTSSAASIPVECNLPSSTVQFTATKYTGNLGGIGGANTKCQAEFPGTYFCNVDGYDKGGSPTNYSAWFNGESTANDCGSYWNSSSSGNSGTLTSFGNPSTAACNLTYSLACCSR